MSKQLAERFPAMQNTIRVRNILTHAYHRYLDDTVWDAANNSIPALHRVLSDLLSELSPQDPSEKPDPSAKFKTTTTKPSADDDDLLDWQTSLDPFGD
ncbi:MAG: DUF86 domain-containing protein [Rhodobacteraceae bacterium]|nr:DUF86 domain-containing protein [Paracoccaceae bacterium]MCY4195772.1 DUF86 domain-containing protein [Paracoccaceae bacterium]